MNQEEPKPTAPRFVDLPTERLPPAESQQRVQAFAQCMKQRRSVRQFSTEQVPLEWIQTAVSAAATAPSGAHKQPWTFCIVTSPELKRQIRQRAEAEEYQSYRHRMNEQWLEDLQPLGTDHHKPFLEEAPYLIAVFKKSYDLVKGKKRQNYYVNESVGIAVGMLLCALHHAGLSTLTHTPSPMNFLSELLDRPANERAFLLIPVGYAAADAKVPDLSRKPLSEVALLYA